MRPIPRSQLYRSLYERLIALWPEAVDSRLTNLVYLMMGIFLTQKVQTGLIANQIPLRAKRMSIIRRLERFLNNPAVRVRAWYAPTARWLLQAAASSGHITLIIDGTKVSFAHQCLMIAVAYHGRALPIAWIWLPRARGHSSQTVQLALLNYVRGLLPASVSVSLVGDTEFGHTLVLDYLDHWGWQYVLRQSGHNQVWTVAGWQALTDLVRGPGDCQWRPNAALTRASPYTTHLCLFWQRGERDPWLLATNLPSAQAALRCYRRRMWIEELFGDLKGHGFDLESSHLRSFRPLSCLTLAVVLLYLWLVTEGTQALIQGRATQVDRTDRRDLSLFRIGVELIKRAITASDPFQVYFALVFDPLPPSFFACNLVSGG